MSEPIIVVCGLGRCGSTLAMRMLHAGGCDVYLDQDQGLSYETRLSTLLPNTWDWLLEMTPGCAVKILDPHRHTPPLIMDRHYRFIWMRRNFRQQAKSMRKFGAACGIIPMPRLGRLIKTIKRDSWKGLQILRELDPSRSTVVEITFESLLADPIIGAQALADATGRDDLDIENMAAQVIQRSPQCYNGLLEVGMAMVEDMDAELQSLDVKSSIEISDADS